MKVIGITGGVGAGKSTVLDYLEREFHAKIVQTDKAGHLVMEPGQGCYAAIVERFGSGILDQAGWIDRKRLGEIVFSNQELLKKLNAIVHPAVKKYVTECLHEGEREGRELFIIESALLFQDDYDAICDEVWYIYASEAVRTRRLQKDRGYSKDRIRGILRNQASDAFFRERCDFVVDNEGDPEDTCRQVRERIQKL